jgi:hypothetical protein
LSQQERNYLKRYASDNGLPLSQYLTAETAHKLTGEGQLIANFAIPPPKPTPDITGTTTPWPPPPSVPKQNFWSLNGSRLLLKSEPDKPSRIFVYETPTDNLWRAGVRAGTVIFRGMRTHDRYTGTAYAFSASCAASRYDVAGTVSEDQRQVTLQGLAPVRDAGCRIMSRRSETLTFIFHDIEDNWGQPR